MWAGSLLLGERCWILGGKMVPFLTVKQKVLVPQGGCPGSVSEAFNHLSQ